MNQDKIKSLEEKIASLSARNKKLSARNKKLSARNKKLSAKNKSAKQNLLQIYEFLLSSNPLEELENTEIGREFLPYLKVIDPKSEVLVLAFGGMRLNLGMPPFEFLRTFTDKNYSCVFFRDHHQVWYQQGLLGFTNDVYETRDLIQSMITDISPRKVIAVGTSAGGYAAIMFGTLLSVNRVLAFAPQTRVGKRVYEEFASIDTPDFQDVSSGENNIWDLSKLIDEHSNSENLPDIHIYYGELFSKDIKQAEYLKTFKNVTLHPVPGSDSHGVAKFLQKQGKLDAILDNACKFD